MGTQSRCAGAPTCVSASAASGLRQHCLALRGHHHAPRSKLNGQSPTKPRAMSDYQASDTMQLITPDTVEALGAVLMNLTAGQSAYVTADDFKKLTGDEISDLTSEGRLMMGNLSARTNCTIETTGGRAVFTKNPARISPTPKPYPRLRRP